MVSDSIEVDVENVGGIESDSVSIGSGITILTGQNATNRTSLIKSIMAGLGSDHIPIRSGTDEGYVSLEVDDRTYKRTVTASDDGSFWDGESVVDNIERLQLFSFLLENNEVRQAVAYNENLYDVVMRPVDTEEIEQQIADLKEERDGIREEKSKLDGKKDKVVQLENNIADKKQKIENFRSELEKVETEIDAIDQDHVESDKIEKSKELNEKIKQKNSKVNNLKEEISDLKELISIRKERLDELRSGTTDNTSELRYKLEHVNGEIDRLQKEVSSLKGDRRTLTPLRRFLNQITSESTSPEKINQVVEKYNNIETVDDSSGEGNITDVLVQSDQTSQCVLCGGNIDENEYEYVLSGMNDVISEIRSKKSKLEDEIHQLQEKKNDIRSEIKSIRSNKDKIDSIENKLDTLNDDLKYKQGKLEQAEAEKEEIEEQIDNLEQEAIKEAESKTSKLQTLEQKKTKVEMEMENAQDSIDSDRDKIHTLEEEIDEIERLIDIEPEINDRLEELRGRVASIEDSIVDRFNNQMEEIIASLSYEGIARIWIEKREIEVREGRKKVDKTVFDLNIVREVDGKVTTDVINNLSESEREVTGLVLALTGYIVHDVADVFPIIMMDSVEMIDASRLESLLDYMDDYVDYLIVAALPEDTEAMDIGSVIKQKRAGV